jgi:purine-binding chemotaxis protein CheW
LVFAHDQGANWQSDKSAASGAVTQLPYQLKGNIMSEAEPAEKAETAKIDEQPAQPLEFLAFTLGKEEYGIDIQRVQELRGYDAVTKIANSPEFIKGVVNLRGVIVPIVDMRIKLNLGTPVYDAFTVVIILNLSGHIIGMVVDSVSDVTTLKPEEIRPAPDLGTTFDTRCLIGIGTHDERMLILLDIAKLMATSEFGLIAKLAA